MKLENIKIKPEIYVMCGLPGSGKSTYIRNLLKNSDKEYVIVSSDDELEKIAKIVGITYTQAFSIYIKQATTYMNSTFKQAIRENKNIVWDQTNLGAKKRKIILQQVPKNYKKIAVIFRIDEQELVNRLKKREQEEGKHIPDHVMQSMAKSFEMPTLSEGFDEIKEISK